MLKKKKIAFFTLLAMLINLCSVNVSLNVAAAYTPAQSGSEEYTWGNVPVGAGGFVTGIAIHPTEPNLVYCRTDVGGVYRWDNENSTWLPLMDEFTYDWSNFYGIDGIALDPNNSDVIYAAAGGSKSSLDDVLKSTDRGKTWQRTNCGGASFDGNGNHRGMGECIAVDPNNSNVVYVGTYNKGLWKTTNGGGSWQKVYATTSPMRNIIFDKASISGGSTRVYAGIVDGGLIVSNNGGGSWSAVSGAPSKINRMAITSNGSVLYAASDTGVYKYTDETWTEISPAANTGMVYNAVTIDASNENNIMCLGPQTKTNYMAVPMWYSSDGGQSWTNKSDTSYLNSSLSWDTKTNVQGFASNAHDLMIDPHNSSKVWMSDWFGVYTTTDIKNSSSQSWEFLYYGMEEVCPRKFISPQSGSYRLIAGIADMDGAVYTDYKSYPKRRIRSGNRIDPPKNTWMMSTADLDYCLADPKIVVRVGIDWNGEAKAELSLDGTETWRNMSFTNTNLISSYSFTQFGQVAVSATKNPDTGYPSIVIIPAGHVPIVSDDLGLTWSDVQGITDTTISTQYWDRGRHLTSDKIDGSAFYIQDRDNSGSNRSKTYVSHDWGHTWTNPTSIGTSNVAWHVDHSQIKAAPYMQNEVWSVTGDRKLYRSSNGGNSFTALSNISDVDCFGFGKNAPGKTNPTIYAFGNVGGTKGIYRSIDMGENWCRLDRVSHPSGCIPNDIEGDMRTFGIVYIATGGRGIFYGEPVDMDPETITPPVSDPTQSYKEQIPPIHLNEAADWSGNNYTISAPSWGRIDFSTWGDNTGQYIYNPHEFTDTFVYMSRQLNVYNNTANMLFCYQNDNNYYKLTLGTETKLSKVADGNETVLGTSSEATIGEMSVRIIRRTDGSIYITKGPKNSNGIGTTLFDVKDNDLTYGKIGLSSANSGGYFANMYVYGTALIEGAVIAPTPQPTEAPTPSPTPEPLKTLAPVLEEDFDNISDTEKALWVNTGSNRINLEIADGVIKGTDWTEGGVFVYTGRTFDSEDYVYTVTLRNNVGGSSSNSGSALFNYTANAGSDGANQTGYAVEVQGGSGGTAALKKYTNGIWSNVETLSTYTHPSSLREKDVTVEIKYAAGGTISVDLIVDGERYDAFDVTDTTYQSGYIGVKKDSSAFIYDDVIIKAMVDVSELPTPTPEPTATPSPAPTATPTPEPVKTLAPVLEEDFDNISDAEKALWVNTGSNRINLEIADGVIKGTDWTEGGVFVYTGRTFDSEDYVYTVTLRNNVGGSSSNSGSALFNYTANAGSDGTNQTGYAVEVQGGSGGTVVLKKYTQDIWNNVEILSTYTHTSSLREKDVTVEIKYAAGGTISVDLIVDGERYDAFDVTDTTYQSGYIGVKKDSSAFIYDDVVIKAMVEVTSDPNEPKYPYEITDISLRSSSGTELDKIPQNESFTVNISVSKQKVREEKDAIYVAVYDADGALLKVNYIPAEFAENYNFDVNIPEYSEKIGNIKVFIWNSSESMQSLCESKSF